MSVWALSAQGQHVHNPNAVFVREFSYIFIFDEIEIGEVLPIAGSVAETLAAGASCTVYGGSVSCCGGSCSKSRATEAVAKAGMGLAPVVAVMSPGMSLSRFRRFILGRLWWPT
jgi:hypothetical protein